VAETTLPVPVSAAVERYLAAVDRALPGRVEGVYLVGSTALGAFRPRRSDVDFVAVLGGGLSDREVARLRAVQGGLYVAELPRAGAGRRWPLVCNGVYVRWADLNRPTAEISPVAGHVSGHFRAGAGFDVNPVTWRTLARHGISARGPHPQELEVHDDDGELLRWNADNLERYWRPWGLAFDGRLTRRFFRRTAAWGVLGAPRLHYTICTGEIASKEAAGEYALDLFGAEWHLLIKEALAFWRGQAPVPPYNSPARRRRDTSRFVAMVVEWGLAEAARRLATATRADRSAPGVASWTDRTRVR
jgi:hypothetical protein